MKYQVTVNHGIATAQVTGQMTFDDRGDAPAMAAALVGKGTKVIVFDLSGVDYIDSAGLGILLTLREKAQETGSAITLKGMTGSVKEVLDLACFDTLFSFES